MPISILNSKKITIFTFKDANLSEIPLDASLNESHNYSSNITRFPIEDGSSISDHIHRDTIKLSITGFVSNSPIRIIGTNNNTLDDLQSGDRRKTAHRRLINLRNSNELFSIVSGLNVYDNMQFISLTFPQNKAIGRDTLQFNAELIQLNISESIELDISDDNVLDKPEGAADRARTTKDVQKQNTVTANKNVEKKTSFFYDTYKFLFGP